MVGLLPNHKVQYWQSESKQWCRYQSSVVPYCLQCNYVVNTESITVCVEDIWLLPYYLNVRVLWTSGAPLSGTAFLLAMFVELWVPENSHTWTLVLKRHSRTAVQLLLGLGANRQDDGNRQVDGPTWDRRGCSDLDQWTKANIITLEMLFTKYYNA